MKSLKPADLKNKTVLLRVDINCPVVKGNVLMSERIKEAAKTILFLKRNGAKIVILTHQGRPGSKDYTSLKQHSALLSKFTKVNFVGDILGKKSKITIKNLKSGEAILLDNIRSIKDEFLPGKNSIIKFFIPLIDVYVNDAFSTCHRNQTSIVSFPKYFPSFPGPSLEKELNALKKIHVQKSVYILGGAKPEDNVRLLDKAELVLSTGIFALYCLEAWGVHAGKQEKILRQNKNFTKIIDEIKKHRKKIMVPVDLAIEIKEKRKEISIVDLPTPYLIPDIGSATIRAYEKVIKNSSSIFMKGPAGNTSIKGFETGTFKLLEAISKSNAFSLMGGGHLSEAINRSKISKKKFNHISLSGGALIAYMAGEKLPGIEALEKGK